MIARTRESLPLQSLLILALCLLLFFPGLNSSGFSQSEGQRVIPAWEMLDNRDFLVTRLFEQPYLRKPPGMPWAVALSSSIFGRTEFAARLVSAVAMTGACLLTLFFAARWFGKPWAWLAAASHALTPFFWYGARSCEIEALNNFGTQAAVLLMLDFYIRPRPCQGSAALGGPLSWSAASPHGTPALPYGRAACFWAASFATAWTIALTLSLLILALVKGVASLPCLAGAVLAPCILARSLKPLRRPSLLIAVTLAGLVIGGIAHAIANRVALLDTPPVLQSPGTFLWNSDRLLRTLLLIPNALVAAMPGSLMIPLALYLTRRGPGEVRTGESDLHTTRAAARALALTSLLALAIYCVIGVGNVRYAMPAVSFIFPLVAFIAREGTPIAESRALRARRLALLVGPTFILAAVAAVFLPFEEARRARNSGLHSGRRLAEILPDRCEIHADQLIETRAEVLLYARAHARELGKELRVRWIPDPGDHPIPNTPDSFLALRTDRRPDQEIDEYAAYLAGGRLDLLEPIFASDVHERKFEYTVYRKKAR